MRKLCLLCLLIFLVACGATEPPSDSETDTAEEVETDPLSEEEYAIGTEGQVADLPIPSPNAPRKVEGAAAVAQDIILNERRIPSGERLIYLPFVSNLPP